LIVTGATAMSAIDAATSASVPHASAAARAGLQQRIRDRLHLAYSVEKLAAEILPLSKRKLSVTTVAFWRVSRSNLHRNALSSTSQRGVLGIAISVRVFQQNRPNCADAAPRPGTGWRWRLR